MRILKRIAIAVGAIIILALVVVYGGSEWMIRQSHAVPLTRLAIPTDAASIAEGARLARIEGCRGCHNDDAAGSVWEDPPAFVATIAPPGIARKAAAYSDAELVRLIRNGVRKDGTTLFVMPTWAHRNLADDDVARIVAWIRTLKPGPKDVTQETSFGPLGRALMVFGQVRPSIQTDVPQVATRPANIGRYYFDSVCSDCHRLGEPNKTDEGTVAPALAPMAASYDPAAFRKLMRTGVGMSGRDLGLMKQVAIESTYALTDAEIVALQDYLKGEAEKGTK